MERRRLPRAPRGAAPARLRRASTPAQPDANEVAGAEFLAAQLAAAGLAPDDRAAGRRPRQPLGVRRGRGPAARSCSPATSTSSRRATPKAWDYPPFGGVDRRPLDVRPRHVRHEEPDHRPAPRDDRRRPRGRADRPQAEAVAPLPRHLQRGDRQRDRHALDPRAPTPSSSRGWGSCSPRAASSRRPRPIEIKYWGIEFAQKRFAEIAFCSADAAKLRAPARRRSGRTTPLDPTIPVSPPVARFLASYARDPRPRDRTAPGSRTRRRPCATGRPSIA